jgi:hypothetical protein
MKIAYIFLFFISTYLVKGQSLTFTVFNKTGQDIDSLRFCDDKRFFRIKSGTHLKIESCKAVSMQDGLPFGFPNGVLLGRKKNEKLRKLCGTGIETINHGSFQADIIMREDNSGYQLFWTQHE